MASNRVLILVVAIVLILLLALAGFYLWLTGGLRRDGSGESSAQTGIVAVRVIESYDGRLMPKPVGVGAAADGGFFVTIRDAQQIVEFTRTGDYVRSWGERGLGSGQMMVPLGVAVDRAGGRIYVTDRSRLRLLCYDPTGNLRWERAVLYPLTPAVVDNGVVVTSFGPIARFDTEGQVQGEVGTRGFDLGQFDYARGIAPAGGNAFIVADSDNARVQRVQLSGDLTATVDWVVGGPPRGSDDVGTRFGVPSSVAVDTSGRAFVLDAFRYAVEVLDVETGEEIHTFELGQGQGPGQFSLPSSIAFLGDRTFAITDTYNDRVQIVRLLLPDDNNVVNRFPWLRWLLLLLLLPLLALMGRKRAFVPRETLERAAGENRLRLLAAVFQTMRVLPSVYDEYKERVEEGVKVGDYLEPVPVTEGDDADPEEALARAAGRTLVRKLLLARHFVVCASAEQAARFAERKVKTRDYDAVVEEYALDAEQSAEG